MGLPKIHKTESGKRYIIINGKRVYIQKGVSKRQVISLYSTLLKGIQPSKKET